VKAAPGLEKTACSSRCSLLRTSWASKWAGVSESDRVVSEMVCKDGGPWHCSLRARQLEHGRLESRSAATRRYQERSGCKVLAWGRRLGPQGRREGGETGRRREGGRGGQNDNLLTPCRTSISCDDKSHMRLAAVSHARHGRGADHRRSKASFSSLDVDGDMIKFSPGRSAEVEVGGDDITCVKAKQACYPGRGNNEVHAVAEIRNRLKSRPINKGTTTSSSTAREKKT